MQTPLHPWHALEASEVEAYISTDHRSGLTEEEAHQRRERYGPNELPRSKPRSAILRFLDKRFHRDCGDGDIDAERRSGPHLALHIDPAFVLFDDAEHGRQAKPGTLAKLLG